ncbi:hypothetical protein [Paenibacillus sp. NPDC093718]|uniref:hypothetical protein n=1 Tax=Paenibacillus sp. NPDC093718 TaxID=3390601 RepID=UPI003D03C81B
MAINYTYSTWKRIPAQLEPYHIIRTGASNVKPETILRPVHNTTYMGINGGFFAADEGYNRPPTASRSIAWAEEDENQTITVEGRTLSKNYLYNGTSANPLSRKTFFIYRNSSGVSTPAYMYASSANDVFGNYGKANVRMIVGGTDFNESSWGTSYNLPLKRTAVSFQGTSVYLMVIASATIPVLRSDIENMGLSPTNTVILDGSNSTQMNVEANGQWIQAPRLSDRYVFNMLRLRNAF